MIRLFAKNIFLATCIFIFIQDAALAQSKQDIDAAKKIISNIYRINFYDHNCETLKVGIDRSYADKLLSTSSYDDYPAKAHEIYELRAKDGAYWNDFFHSFYIDNIATEYSRYCQKNYKPQSSMERDLVDFRFPHNFDDLGSFIIKDLQFGKFTKKNSKLSTNVTVTLKNGEKFTLTYMLQNGSSGWRIFDILERQSAVDRDASYISGSLQQAIQARAARRSEK